MKTFLFILLILTICSKLQAQNPFAWQHCYGTSGSEVGYCMIPVSSGGYLMGGSHFGEGAYFVRVDANGLVMWEKHYPIQNTTGSPSSICEDASGNFMVVGYGSVDTTSTPFDVFLLKMNPQGDTLWTRVLADNGNGFLYSIKVLNDQNFVIAGRMNESATLLKIDGNGNILWQNYYTNSNNLFTSFTCAEPVNFNILSFLYEPGRTFLFNPNGDSIYTKPNYLYPNRTFLTSTGDVLQTNTHSLIKTTPQGDTIWKKTYGFFNASIGPIAVSETPDGNYVGLMRLFNGNDYDLGLVLTDSNGNKLRDTVLLRFGPNEYPHDIAIAANGDYVLFGNTTVGCFGQSDMILLQFKKWNIPLGLQEDAEAEIKSTLFTAYPNPAHAKLNIKLKRGQPGWLQLYTIQGQLLASQQIAGQAELDLSSHPAGLYMLRFTSSSGKSQTQKIIKH